MRHTTREWLARQCLRDTQSMDMNIIILDMNIIILSHVTRIELDEDPL